MKPRATDIVDADGIGAQRVVAQRLDNGVRQLLFQTGSARRGRRRRYVRFADVELARPVGRPHHNVELLPLQRRRRHLQGKMFLSSP